MYSAQVVVVEESNEYVVFELEYCCELHFFVRLGPVWMQRFRSVPPSYKSVFSFRFKRERGQFSQHNRLPNGVIP